MAKFSWEYEWRKQKLKEETFLVNHMVEKTAGWTHMVEEKVPEKLQGTLEKAFGKAFVAVFEKGGAIIEKTYNRKKKESNFQKNKDLLEQGAGKSKALKKIEWQAKCSIGKNLALSSVEGIGLGAIGIGVPDIPIFVSVLLKSIYEIAISYGYSYTEDKERLFILKLIDTALQTGEVLQKKDNDLNVFIEQELKEKKREDKVITDPFVTKLKIVRQIDYSAKALSDELLYGKFVQGVAVVGIIGGTADITCLKKITEYAILKYKRRFLLEQNENSLVMD